MSLLSSLESEEVADFLVAWREDLRRRAERHGQAALEENRRARAEGGFNSHDLAAICNAAKAGALNDVVAAFDTQIAKFAGEFDPAKFRIVALPSRK